MVNGKHKDKQDDGGCSSAPPRRNVGKKYRRLSANWNPSPQHSQATGKEVKKYIYPAWVPVNGEATVLTSVYLRILALSFQRESRITFQI